MDYSFHYLLMANQALFQKSLFDKIKHSGLTSGQPKILDYLKEHNGASQKEIAAGCHIEAGSLTSVLNRMEEKGIIERCMLNGNRRTYHIFLTKEGAALQEIVENAFSELEQTVLDSISEDDLAVFMRVFLQIYENQTKGD